MVYFGCSQWGYSNWKGSIYPKGLKPGNYLYNYAKTFNTVELNPTFHDYVEPDRILHWKDETGPGFKFCPKFPRIISHDKLLYGVKELTDEFISRINLFGEKLGISFLQLAPSFMPDELNVLESFLKSLPPDFRISIQPRPEFIISEETNRDFNRILAENNAGIVILDNRRTLSIMNKYKLTNHTAFIRFECYGYKVDKPRIDNWIKMISKWCEKGLSEIYFFLHFPDTETDLDILFYAMDKFKEHFG